jgi:hypothetical protein
MAREARKQLADLRAMEEEHERITMRGRGKTFHGAGATPSMGLSQFRGGAKYESESEDEDDMEGGNIANIIRGSIGSIGRTVGSVGSRLGRLGRFGRSNRVAPTSTDLVVLGNAGRPLATPSMGRSFYQNLFTPSSTALSTRLASTAGRSLNAQKIAQAIAMGIPLASIAAYLASQDKQSGQAEDGGYYDDYLGQEFAPQGPTYGPSDGPIDGGVPIDDMGVASGGIPSDMTGDELAWYLQTGNLPARYSVRASRSKRGKGKLTITHGDEMGSDLPAKYIKPPTRGGPAKGKEPEMLLRDSARRPIEEAFIGLPPKYELPPTRGGPAKGKKTVILPRDGRTARADIVRQVMAERGVSLPQASSIVKNEGLY